MMLYEEFVKDTFLKVSWEDYDGRECSCTFDLETGLMYQKDVGDYGFREGRCHIVHAPTGLTLRAADVWFWQRGFGDGVVVRSTNAASRGLFEKVKFAYETLSQKGMSVLEANEFLAKLTKE